MYLGQIEKGSQVVKRDKKSIGQAMRLAYFPVVAIKAEGSRVWDKDGNEYIDFLGGAASLPIGHRHPAVVKAIQEQADQLIHYPQFHQMHILASPFSSHLLELSSLEGVH